MRIINKIYINGKFVGPHGAQKQTLFNPATAERIGEVWLADEVDVDQAVAAAREAFGSFSKSSLADRSALLTRLHASIMAREDELNAAAVLEYGSPISATVGRTRYAAQVFLDAKDAMMQFDFETRLPYAQIIKEPLGVIAAITPWNANYTHICGKLAPAIATGCTIVIKPSESSALQTQILTECFHDARIPAGIINVLNGDGPGVGAAMTAHNGVDLVTFTGSSQVGKIIRKSATDTMKRVVLELGGKSPNVILDDADLEKAIPMALVIAFSNSGQACHAGSRLLVHAKQFSRVKELLISSLGKLKIGDLWDEKSFIGPMVSQTQYNTVQAYIQKGIDEGAQLLAGGLGHPEGLGGYYVRPTIFTGVTNDMTIAQEEIFGPVLSVITYSSDQQAVDISNDTIYGLSAYVSSGSMERAARLASGIVSGRVLINTATNRETRTPFGGFKQSGIGRTSYSYGLAEYVEEKVIAY
ncbi:aldehyde dehydrogenase family protein [Pedobacter panaciterrae]|uniref:aldehyde dehydrogenase family protein n=1 Tax=Pedobacter panaciterrae TaxID=363849 RepID=UPI00259843E3|nr:aldehyde dehydrogenase family protein [uncultured Pedobacter sp.]